MNFSYFIARRVARSGQQSFSRLIIRIAVIAVALSVAVMIATNALVAGFKKEISSKIFGFWGHIHITDTDISTSLLEAYPIKTQQPFYPDATDIKEIEYYETRRFLGWEQERLTRTKGGIRHIQTFAVKPGIIKARSDIEGILLKGVGQDFDWQFMEQYLVKGQRIALPDTAMSSDILISQQTASRLRIDTGDSFIVHFIQKGDQLKRRFTVSGIYKTGLEEYDKVFALVDIRQVQRLLGWEADEVGGFEVFLDDLADLPVLTEYLYYEKLPNNLYAETIREKLPEIFEWLELQNINEVVILSLMIVVAIINMITALLILILERTNMVGTLKALGGTNWAIRKVFLYYAAYIVLVGLFWGNLMGIGLCLMQEQFGLIRLSEENYYLTVAPIQLQWWSILIINVGTLIITLVFLILPSYLVSSISPVKAIRFN
ncbi:MAG TPA: ABC transporter permease [Saprospiraceae bacterium]|nr:ABC transporter permease [Saprospiraceae bacterium]HMP24111.1 ABC transporter permease [Saprospiraceae bacterium]